MAIKSFLTSFLVSLLFINSDGAGQCVAPTSQQIGNLTTNNDYLCLRPDFTITQYASSADSPSGLVKPRIMDHIIYQNNLIVYAGSVKDWTANFSAVPGTHVRAMVDTDMDGTRDYTVDVFSIGNEEFNVVTIDPVTNYVYLVSQENMYQCDNLHAYTMDLVNNVGAVTDGGCKLFIAFPGHAVELTHARHYAEFSLPDYKDLCVAFGADCDNCVEQTVPRTRIMCYDMSVIRSKYDSNSFPIAWNVPEARDVAYGVRNSVGFDWHPETYDLWFTDNGANSIWDTASNGGVAWKSESPDDELNVVVVGEEGGHYGYPFVHTEGTGNLYIRDLNNVSLSFEDPMLYDQRPSGMEFNNFQMAKQAMSPHSAVLGIKFYNRDQLILDNCNRGEKPKLFPSKYNNVAIIAEHGSWADQWGGYEIVTGYRVVTVDINTTTNTITDLSNFVYGFREEKSYCGTCLPAGWSRPGFIEILYDGSILISDDTSHYVWRVEYNGADATTYKCPTSSPTMQPSKNPTFVPSFSPSQQTDNPSMTPTMYPSYTPTEITYNPSKATLNPSMSGTEIDESKSPSMNPSMSPSTDIQQPAVGVIYKSLISSIVALFVLLYVL